MVNGGRSVHQVSYELACEVLAGVLRSAVREGGVDRCAAGSVPCRAAAALFVLLAGHPVNRRGRCRSCRRPGAVFGWRRRRCQVHNEARAWLHQPAEFVDSRLARELALPLTAQSVDSDITQPLFQAVSGLDELPTDPQSPAVSPCAFLPGGIPGAGQPVPDHGVAGACPEPLRSRRDPSDEHQPPLQMQSLRRIGPGPAGLVVGLEAGR